MKEWRFLHDQRRHCSLDQKGRVSRAAYGIWRSIMSGSMFITNIMSGSMFITKFIFVVIIFDFPTFLAMFFVMGQQNGQLPEPVAQNECSGQSCKSSVGELFDEAVPVAAIPPTTQQQQSIAVGSANNGIPSQVCQRNEDSKESYCCNNELKQAMRDAYASAGVCCPRKDCPEAGCFHCCNTQRLANLIQAHCEQRFGVTFEVIVGLRDFSLHSHYYENYLCKISEGESRIAAFASARGVCLADGSPANTNNGTIPAMCGRGAATEGEEEQQQRDGEKCGEQKRGPELDEDYHLAEEGSGRDGTKNSE
uniref:Ground-like domain-containing protein n=1 Tax=Globodera pallida TaxID=36090 RepID=A0A183CIX7_GLOPA